MPCSFLVDLPYSIHNLRDTSLVSRSCSFPTNSSINRLSCINPLSSRSSTPLHISREQKLRYPRSRRFQLQLSLQPRGCSTNNTSTFSMTQIRIFTYCKPSRSLNQTRLYSSGVLETPFYDLIYLATPACVRKPATSTNESSNGHPAHTMFYNVRRIPRACAARMLL